MLARPKDEKEKQLFDAVGTIRAARFVRKYAKSKKPIDVGIVYDIHKEIYKDWWPEMAGKPREEEVEIWHSKHLPPHHLQIREHMHYLNEELQKGLAQIDDYQDYEPLMDMITDGLLLEKANKLSGSIRLFNRG